MDNVGNSASSMFSQVCEQTKILDRQASALENIYEELRELRESQVFRDMAKSLRELEKVLARRSNDD